MKQIQPSAQLVTGYENRPEELIELCGRICYDSRDKIAPGTAQKFCEKLKKSGHTSVLEHANIVLEVSTLTGVIARDSAQYYEEITGLPAYMRFDVYGNHKRHFVSGNVRAWVNVLDCLSEHYGMIPPCVLDALDASNVCPSLFNIDRWRKSTWHGRIDKHRKATVIDCNDLPKWARERHTTATFFITCDRGVSHELVRHRAASFSQQSTRYCKSNKDGGIGYIVPSIQCIGNTHNWDDLTGAVFESECRYAHMLENGASPQIARAVLPTCLATKLYMTMTIERWRDFLKLRLSPAAHPDMRVIAEQIQQQLFPKGVKL